MSTTDGAVASIGPDVVYDEHELACLARLAGAPAIVGLDGGTGFIGTWGDPAKGRAKLEERGILHVAGDDEEQPDDHTAIPEPLRSMLATLFGSTERLALRVTRGAVNVAVVIAPTGRGACVALPRAASAGVAVCFVRMLMADVIELVEATVQPDGEHDGSGSTSTTMPVDELDALRVRLAIPGVDHDTEAQAVHADLVGYGFSEDDAAELVGILREGGSAITSQHLRHDRQAAQLEERFFLGGPRGWWEVLDEDELVTVQRTGAAQVRAALSAPLRGVGEVAT